MLYIALLVSALLAILLAVDYAHKHDENDYSQQNRWFITEVIQI